MNISGTAKTRLFQQWLRGSCMAAVAVAACLMFSATTALAGCGASANLQQGHFIQHSALAGVLPVAEHGEPSVIGLWHVELLNTDGSLFFQSLVQYHPGGMEMESADVDPVAGNFCMGVWEQEGRTVKVYHVAWLSPTGETPNATPSGYGIFTYVDTLSPDGNSYQGVFDIKVYDSGNKELAEIHGTVKAKRIDFNHPYTSF